MMKKHILFVLLALFSINIFADSSGSCGENVTWRYVTATKTLTISGSGPMYNFTIHSALWLDSDIKTVVIDEGVTTIGAYSFYRIPFLASVIIPNSIESIGNYAFGNSTNLTSITIPNNVTSIGKMAFYNCYGLTSINIFNSETSINDDTFLNCTGLTSVTFHCKIIPKIHSWFSVSSIKEITIGDEVETIGEQAFAGYSGLTSITIPNSVTSIGNSAFNNCTGLTSIDIPNSVTSIGSYAFSGCSGLTSITIPNSVTSIGNSAFYNNTGLTSVDIPNSVTSIGEQAFYGCSGLTSINIPNSVISIGSSAFYGCSGLTSIDIPNSVTSIDEQAFYGCSGLTSITIPNSVTSIGSSAFRSCTGLTSIDIPNSVTSIGDYAFISCSGLTSINIPNSVISLGRSPFGGCSGLTSIIIPKSVNLSYNFFDGCNSLREIVYTSSTPPTDWVMTTSTYVPDKQRYTNPYKRLFNDARLIEMITFDKNEFEYTGQAPTPTWTNNLSGYTEFLDLSALNGEIGSHEETIPTTFTKGNVSFTADVVFRYTIKPAKLIAKVESMSREYGAENPQFNITYSGFANGEDENILTTKPTISTTAMKTSNVGEYPISISGGSAANYELAYEPGVLTVTKAPLSAKVSDATKVYGSQNPSFDLTYEGLKNGETAPMWRSRPSFQTEATPNSGVGQYEVKAVNGVPVNYDLGEITAGTLTITPAPLTIRANDAVRQYYSDGPRLGYTCSGFVNGDNESALSVKPVLSTSATQTSGVGTYEIEASGAASPNYSISHVNGTLTITPRMLTVKVGNYERLYDEENPTFEVKYDGFAGDDNAETLSVKPTASTSATKSSDVGIYPINITGGSADNYDFSYTPGTLTINKAEQAITWEQDLSQLKVGDQVELKAAASSGLPVTYLIDANGGTEIYSVGNKSYMDCLSGGHFLIRAVQEGNNNYYSSPRVSNTALVSGNAISDPVLTIVQADNGSISTQIAKGSTYTFKIMAESGWKIHSLSFNGMDVTDQLNSENAFTTPAITENATLSVTYEEDVPTSIPSSAKSSAKIHATSFGARVTDATSGDIIQVYTTDGVLQKTVKADRATIDVPLAKDEVYIIKVAEKTLKLRH